MNIEEFQSLAGSIGPAAAYGRAVNSPDWGTVMACRIPEHMQMGMARYVLFGVAPGDFLQAVLRNDLMGAAGQADSINALNLFEYAVFLRSAAPSTCWGSESAVTEWSGRGGMYPQDQAA